MPVTNRINDKIIKNNGGTFTIKSQTITSLQRQLKDAHRSSPILMSFVAGGLASIGLSTNSATTIIGSMLLSPIGSLINKSNIYWLLNNNGIRMKEKYSHWYQVTGSSHHKAHYFPLLRLSPFLLWH